MSWSLNLIGVKADVQACVKAQIVDNGYAPEIGMAIIAEISAMPGPTGVPDGQWSATHVSVRGCGHKGGSSELKIEAFTPCIAPPPPQPKS
jgi:hypothetical protein